MVEPIQDWPWDIHYLDVLAETDINTPVYRFFRDTIEVINRLILEVEQLRGVIIGAPSDGLLLETGGNIFLEDGITFFVLES